MAWMRSRRGINGMGVQAVASESARGYGPKGRVAMAGRHSVLAKHRVLRPSHRGFGCRIEPLWEGREARCLSPEPRQPHRRIPGTRIVDDTRDHLEPVVREQHP